MWVTKLLISPVKKRIFCPKTTKFGPNFGIFGQFGPGQAGSFNALLVGRLVVVGRGLYLARHLFTLICFLFHINYIYYFLSKSSQTIMQPQINPSSTNTKHPVLATPSPTLWPQPVSPVQQIVTICPTCRIWNMSSAS